MIKGSKPEAHFQCKDCGTFQCQICEELIHENEKFVFHERQRLVATPINLICQNNCEDRNLCDIHCTDCNKNYCFACDFSTHQNNNKKKHSREPFKADREKEEVEKQNNIDDEEDEEQFVSFENRNNSKVDSLANVDLESDNDNDISRNSKLPKDKKLKKSDLKNQFKELPDIAQLSLESPKENSVYSASTGVKVGVKMTTDGITSNSFLLIDENEILQINSSDEFAHKLGCNPSTLIKVVSIFGNTGEGKSHTLNYTFFDGHEIFKTSPSQSSCTIGIWCAYDPKCRIITIDTEGLLGISENNNRRTRLLLKVLAISDIIIYRTRAERLHNDLFTFLGDASKAYVQHFSKELKAASTRCNLSCPLSDLVNNEFFFYQKSIIYITISS